MQDLDIDLKEKLRVILKKCIARSGRDLENYCIQVLDLYKRPTDKQELISTVAYQIRDCVDDRGWETEKHLDTIHNFLRNTT